jgi:hypothetical protein
LKKDFTLEKLKVAMFEMVANKVAGRDGFNAEFYQKTRN